jgi:hypothetical protein
MSNGKTQAQLMSVTKRVLAYYEGGVPEDSPDQPKAQRTVKRGSNVEATASVSMKKRDTSQDQTTIKKVNSL